MDPRTNERKTNEVVTPPSATLGEVEEVLKLMMVEFKKITEKIEEIDIRTSKMSSRSTSRSSTPPPHTNPLSTPLHNLGNRKAFTPSTSMKMGDLEYILKHLEQEHKVLPPKRALRRETVFEEVVRAQQTDAEATGHVVIQPESYLKITLDELKLDAVLNFYSEVHSYDLQHVIKVPKLFLRFSPAVRATIMCELMKIKPTSYTNSELVTTASREDINDAIMYYFCPKDRLNFVIKLQESCQSYAVPKVNEKDFAETTVALTILREKFMERYRFLVKACESCSKEDAIPDITFRSGLLKTFIELTPRDIQNSFRYLLEPIKTFATMDEFMTSYFLIVQDTYECSEKSRTYQERLNRDPTRRRYLEDAELENNKRGDYKRYPQNSHQQDFRSNNYRNSFTPRRDSSSRSAFTPRRESRLHMMQQNEDDQEFAPDEEELEIHREINEEGEIEGVGEEEFEEENENEVMVTSRFTAQRQNANDQRDYQKRTQFRRHEQNHYDERPKGICITYERNGICGKDKCNFSHKSEDIQAYRKAVAERYEATKKKDSQANVRGPQVPVQRRLYPNSGQKVMMMQSSEEQGDETGEFSLISELFKVTETSDNWKAFHSPAMITLRDGSSIYMRATLFDTGADKDNYISTAAIEYYDLVSYLTPIKGAVKVANGKQVNIDSQLRVNVTFIDNTGQPHSANLQFMVLEGLNKDLVLGTPAILKHYYQIFQELMSDARDKILNTTTHGMINVMSDTLKNDFVGDLQPWTYIPDNEAPEELEIPEFGKFLYMEVSIEEATRKYYEMLPSRVSEEFKSQTNIMHLLETLGEEVFNPKSWNGVTEYIIDLEFSPDMPERIKPRSYSIPPAQFENVRTEVTRLCSTIWEPSTSPIASPMVVASKATPPFIRLCGDFRIINKYIKAHHYPIPNIIHEIHKMMRFKIYSDCDLMNSFHQLKLSPSSAKRLSVQTPFGQFQPRFLPEGVAPASAYLMAVVVEIFADFNEWIICIFDNILILAHDHQDMYEKVEKVLMRCKERNLVLKLSKSNFGVREVEFFGYLVNQSGYRLSDERKNSVSAIPFPEPPKQQKKMQSFLGAANYFKNFIPLFSEKTNLLTDMIHKKFNWDEDTWTVDYKKAFEDFKGEIMKAQFTFHPCYELEWVLCVDASDVAIGGVLFQIPENAATFADMQVIAFISKKLSPTARRWSVIERECYSIFFSVKKLSYYLFGKSFTIRTDHHNLLWMEASEVPKIIRMRMYLQSFKFTLKHIKGSDNVFADFLSRIEVKEDVMMLLTMVHVDNVEVEGKWEENDALKEEESVIVEQMLEDVDVKPKSVDEAIKLVHNANVGHHGSVRTWLKLKKAFPGNTIPIHVVEDFIKECGICQKNRLDMSTSLAAPIRRLNSESVRQYCGYDTVYVSPPTKDGYQYLHHIRLLPARLTALYPSKDLSAESVATALFSFFLTYGITDILITDAGSNINASVVKLLLKWMGVRLRVALTNRHQSNMVERVHREALRFLTDLVHEERVIEIWARPNIIGMIQFLINDEKSKETGVTPFQFVFGNIDIPYFRIPELMSDEMKVNEYMDTLDSHLKIIREAAIKVQEKEQLKRKKANPQAGVNTYAIGDYVLLRQDPTKFKSTKLSSKFKGPFVVVQIYKADISVRNLINGMIQTYHMEHLKPFFGDEKEAMKLAKLDENQYFVKKILGYKGDPLKRTSTEYFVEFEDDDQVWIQYNKDLYETSQFVEFCQQKDELYPLLFSDKEWKKRMSELNNQQIESNLLKKIFYLNLRYFGMGYYDNLNLPDKYIKDYVVQCIYHKWLSKERYSIGIRCEIFNLTIDWNNANVKLFGKSFELKSNTELVDESFKVKYPEVFD